MKSIRCYRYNKYGHLAQNCNKPTVKADTKKPDCVLYSALSTNSGYAGDDCSWYLDSPTTVYMTNHSELLKDVKKIVECTVITANKRVKSSRKCLFACFNFFGS